MTKKNKKPTNHYVDNKKLHEVLLEYKKACHDADLKCHPKPPIPSYVGECILEIAKRFANRPNFINYSYKDEMISDGVENCILYLDRFDPHNYKNPFAYFTQIMFFAFIRRIAKEKKQQYIKIKSLEAAVLQDMLVENGGELQEHFGAPFADVDSSNKQKLIDQFDKPKLPKTKEKGKFKSKRG